MTTARLRLVASNAAPQPAPEGHLYSLSCTCGPGLSGTRCPTCYRYFHIQQRIAATKSAHRAPPPLIWPLISRHAAR